MILILARGSDYAAGALVKRWASHNARLLVPEDLSVVGWCHYSGSLANSRAVAGGSAVPVADIRGVLVRIPGIMPSDLPHLLPEDRVYTAMEMTAFLLAWLSNLRCPVLNRPSPIGLAGPCFRPEQWVHVAARAGIPVAAVTRTGKGYINPLSAEDALSVVAVVGERCIGAASAELATRARRIAAVAKVSLMNAYFVGPLDAPLFAGADLEVDITNPDIADAVLALFQNDFENREVVS